MASRDLYNNVSPAPSVRAQAITAITNGEAVDLNGYESADVLIDLGVFSGTIPSAEVQILESDDDETYTAVADGDLHGGALPATIDTTNDALLYERGYIGHKRYLRVDVTAISGTTPSLPMSAVVVRGNPHSPPV